MNLKVFYKVISTLLVSSSICEVSAISDEIQYGHGSVTPDHIKYCPEGATPLLTTYGASKGRDVLYKNAWSGTKKDLEAIVEKAKQKYGFENSKHLGRNATMPVPATLRGMKDEIGKYGNDVGWDGPKTWDGWHNQSARKEDGWAKAAWNSVNSGVEKYVNKFGDEVVYDIKTGKIVMDGHMGTKNLSAEHKGSHAGLDVAPHRASDDYKYVGILYERDPNNPDKFYIINGQTGLPMTPQQVAEMPTTLSDMWKDMGLACVENDAEDVVAPVQNQNSPVASIDTSLLESILNEQIAFVKGLLVKGEKASQSEIKTYNARLRKFLNELVKVDKEIASLDISAEDKKKVEEKVIARLTPLTVQLEELNAQVLSLKLVEELIPMTLDSVRPASGNGTVKSR